MNKHELMIGDIVVSPKDLIRMEVTEVKSTTVGLVSLGKRTTKSERSYEEIEPLLFFDERIFKALGFVIRTISTFREGAKSERLLQLFDEEDNNRFFTLKVEKRDDTSWYVNISDRNFKTAGGGCFVYVHELQNIVRSCTGLEFTISENSL